MTFLSVGTSSQTALTRTFLSGKRRRSSTELPYADLPDSPVADATAASDVRLALRDALAELSPLALRKDQP